MLQRAPGTDIKQALHEALEQKISIDALAEVAGLSTCHFARTFKQSEGMSPHRYVLQCRAGFSCSWAFPCVTCLVEGGARHEAEASV
jgi:AraC-like DNA-binding protein